MTRKMDGDIRRQVHQNNQPTVFKQNYYRLGCPPSRAAHITQNPPLQSLNRNPLLPHPNLSPLSPVAAGPALNFNNRPGILGYLPMPCRPVNKFQNSQMLSLHQRLPSYSNSFQPSHVAVGPALTVRQNFNDRPGLLGYPPMNQRLPSYHNRFQPSHVAVGPALTARQNFNDRPGLLGYRPMNQQLPSYSNHFPPSHVPAAGSASTMARQNFNFNPLFGQTRTPAVPRIFNASPQFQRSANYNSVRPIVPSLNKDEFIPSLGTSKKIKGTTSSIHSKDLSVLSHLENLSSPSPASPVNTCVAMSSLTLDVEKTGTNSVVPMNNLSNILSESSTTASSCSMTPVSVSETINLSSTSSPEIASYSANPIKETTEMLNIHSTDTIASSQCVTSTNDFNDPLSIPSAIAVLASDVAVTIDFQNEISSGEMNVDLGSSSSSLDRAEFSKGTFLEGDQNLNIHKSTSSLQKRIAKSILLRKPHGEDNIPKKASTITLSSIVDDAKAVSVLQNPSVRPLTEAESGSISSRQHQQKPQPLTQGLIPNRQKGGQQKKPQPLVQYSILNRQQANQQKPQPLVQYSILNRPQANQQKPQPLVQYSILSRPQANQQKPQPHMQYSIMSRPQANQQKPQPLVQCSTSKRQQANQQKPQPLMQGLTPNLAATVTDGDSLVSH